ncbi:MAG: hypothetical protein MR966_14800 [Lachnospiraceae bacterium]|nr:hypothetical protein [Lachnospiraceae bacterium]
MRKNVFMLIILTLCLLFSGCSGEQTGKKGSEKNQNPENRIIIAVATYDRQDPEVRAFQNYYENYISECFPVDFLYPGSISSAEDEADFVDRVITAGAKGIISFITYDLESTLETCEKSGVYYMMGSGSIPKEDFEKVKTNPYFLGVIGPSEEMEQNAGADMTSFFMKKQAEADTPSGYLVLSGGTKYNNSMHTYRTEAMLETLGFSPAQAAVTEPAVLENENGKVCIIPGYPQEEAAVSALKEQLNTGEYSVILSCCTVVNLLDTIKEARETTGIDIQTGTVDCFTSENLDAVHDGLLQYVTGKYSSLLGPSFAVMYNAVTGHADLYRNEDGTAFSIAQGFWTADSPEAYEELYGLTTGIYVNAYNADDLSKVINEITPDADMEDLIHLAEAYSIEDVKARREN